MLTEKASRQPIIRDEPMKKALVVGIFLSAVVATQPTAAQYVRPASPSSDDIARYNLASTEARRRFFAAAMSSLSPDQLQTFWARLRRLREREGRDRDGSNGSRHEVLGCVH